MRSQTFAVAIALSLVSLSIPTLAVKAEAQALAYCKADAARLCPGVAPGGGRLAGCLKAHQDEVSIGCAKELRKVKGEMGK
jgi:Cysteine rich repeat